MWKKCTLLWREAHFQVKIYKTRYRGSDHFWRFRCGKSARRCGAKHISKSKCFKICKTPGVRTTFGGSDVASLCSTTLHYITLHYATLHYTTLNYATLHYITLHYLPLHYTTFHYTSLHSTTLHSTKLHLQLQLQLHYTPLHSTTLHHTTLHYTALHSSTLQIQL